MFWAGLLCGFYASLYLFKHKESSFLANVSVSLIAGLSWPIFLAGLLVGNKKQLSGLLISLLCKVDSLFKQFGV